MKAFCILDQGRVRLTPYLRPMVPRYNHWMQDEDLLQQTASERLTLQEELDNQVSWCLDPSKYTFVIFCQSEVPDPPLALPMTQGYSMVGDINVFFTGSLEPHEAELTVMIAEPGFRRQGIAQQAIEMMMSFIYSTYQKSCFIIKISNENTASLSLFKKLGFRVTKEVAVFQEIHLEKDIRDDSPADYLLTSIHIDDYIH